MTIVRYNPNRSLNRVARDFDSMFENFFNFSDSGINTSGATLFRLRFGL